MVRSIVKGTLGVAVNALFCVASLGVAVTAIADGVPCKNYTEYQCNAGCTVSFTDFNCCSTYSNACCQRTCTNWTCKHSDGSQCQPPGQTYSDGDLPGGTCQTNGLCQ